MGGAIVYFLGDNVAEYYGIIPDLICKVNTRKMENRETEVSLFINSLFISACPKQTQLDLSPKLEMSSSQSRLYAFGSCGVSFGKARCTTTSFNSFL
jgi:hypothetical protein